MTSSQTLLVNLLGPLSFDPAWMVRVLRTILDRPDFVDLESVEIEFAPSARSRYLGDMTRVDAFFRLRSDAGIEGIVLELKYTDRFSARRVPIAENGRYLDLAEATNLWRSPSDAFSDGEVSQLVRCHALGMRTLQVEHQSTLPVTLLVVSHPLDSGASSVVDRYRRHLTSPTGVVHLTLDRFLDACLDQALSTSDQGGIQDLCLRYLEHERSEHLWREHIKAPSPGGRPEERGPSKQRTRLGANANPLASRALRVALRSSMLDP